MRRRDLLRAAWESVCDHPQRVLASSLGVFAGAAALVVLLAWAAGFEEAMTVELGRYGRGGLFVIPGSTSSGFPGYRDGVPVRASREDAEVAERDNTETVEAVFAIHRSQRRALVEAAGRVRRLDLDGTDPRFPAYRNYRIAAGRFFDDVDLARAAPVAVLGYDAAEELFDEPSAAIGRLLRVDGAPLRLIGVLARKNGRQYFNTNRPDNRLVLVPSTTAEERLGYDPDRVSFFQVFLRPGADGEAAYRGFVASLAARRHVHPLDTDALRHFDLSSMNDLMSLLAGAFAVFVGLAGTITLAVGAIGIANYQLSVIEERTAEIAVAKAVGARAATLAAQAAFEAVCVAVAAAGSGALVGAGLALGIAALSPPGMLMDPRVSPGVIGFATLMLAGVAVLAALAPARRVRNLDVSIALRAAG